MGKRVRTVAEAAVLILFIEVKLKLLFGIPTNPLNVLSNCVTIYLVIYLLGKMMLSTE